MNKFWNERYSQKEYAYGTNPNDFFKKSLENLTIGKMLLPGEGEGRNAVYAAKLGWDVTAFDFSHSAKKKAFALAEKEGVKIKYSVKSYVDFNPRLAEFDCIASIFVHTPKETRKSFHNKLITLLRPGGRIILEGFSKEQINNNSGGPKNIDMLFSKNELLEDFKAVQKVEIAEKEIELNEGQFHQGIAYTIQLIAIK